MHENSKCVLQDPEKHQKLNATFEMVIGWASDGIVREGVLNSGIQGKLGERVSFGAVNVPGQYLLHGNGEMRLQKVGDDAAAMANGTFKVHKGLYRSSAISLEAFNLPDHFFQSSPTEPFMCSSATHPRNLPVQRPFRSVLQNFASGKM